MVEAQSVFELFELGDLPLVAFEDNCNGIDDVPLHEFLAGSDGEVNLLDDTGQMVDVLATLHFSLCCLHLFLFFLLHLPRKVLICLYEAFPVDALGNLVHDQNEVNSLMEILVILNGQQSEPILDEPMLQDVMIDLLRISIGPHFAYFLYLDLAFLPTLRGETQMRDFFVGWGFQEEMELLVDDWGVEVEVDVGGLDVVSREEGVGRH